MLLYHGSNTDIKCIDLAMCRPYKDFGRGFTDYSSPECNLDNKYDIVVGPVADDDMAMLFRQYQNEIITFENLISGMTFRKTTNQYSFHTEMAVALLRNVGVFHD